MFRLFKICAPSLLISVLCACSLQSGSRVPLVQTPELVETPSSATPQQVEVPRSKFQCSPEKLHPGDKLVITMDAPHAGELGILSPNREAFFYYAFEQPDKDSLTQPIIQARDFKNMKVLQLSTAEAKGLVSKGEMEEPATELIFQKAGEYQIFMGDPLDVDLEDINPEGFCSVEYVAEPRPR